MKNIVTILCLFVFTTVTLQAQRKSELIAEIENLKSEKDSLRSVIRVAQKNESVAQARAASFESQVAELQEANRNLMANMSNFTTVSTKNSEIATSAMASLEAKENQLKSIKNAIASNDSTIIVVLTNAKQTLGENAKIGVSEGAVVVSTDLATLYGSDSGTELTPEAETWAEKIADLLKANPTTAVDIEGLSMTGDLNLPAQQAMALSTVLQNKFAIDSERIVTLGRDGNLKEGVQIRIHPKFNDFYLMVREELKN
jgi:outer membrane protein OmpA-like peptidoglycan-associated protein